MFCANARKHKLVSTRIVICSNKCVRSTSRSMFLCSFVLCVNGKWTGWAICSHLSSGPFTPATSWRSSRIDPINYHWNVWQFGTNSNSWPVWIGLYSSIKWPKPKRRNSSMPVTLWLGVGQLPPMCSSLDKAVLSAGARPETSDVWWFRAKLQSGKAGFYCTSYAASDAANRIQWGKHRTRKRSVSL